MGFLVYSSLHLKLDFRSGLSHPFRSQIFDTKATVQNITFQITSWHFFPNAKMTPISIILRQFCTWKNMEHKTEKVFESYMLFCLKPLCLWREYMNEHTWDKCVEWWCCLTLTEKKESFSWLIHLFAWPWILSSLLSCIYVSTLFTQGFEWENFLFSSTDEVDTNTRHYSVSQPPIQLA